MNSIEGPTFASYVRCLCFAFSLHCAAYDVPFDDRRMLTENLTFFNRCDPHFYHRNNASRRQLQHDGESLFITESRFDRLELQAAFDIPSGNPYELSELRVL